MPTYGDIWLATATRHRYSESNVSARYFCTLSGDQCCGGVAANVVPKTANARGTISLRHVSGCRGCWRDESVPPNAAGTVLALVVGPLYVWHERRPSCELGVPHHADECGLFEPPRWRVLDPPHDRVRRWMGEADWRRYFAAVDAERAPL